MSVGSSRKYILGWGQEFKEFWRIRPEKEKEWEAGWSRESQPPRQLLQKDQVAPEGSSGALERFVLSHRLGLWPNEHGVGSKAQADSYNCRQSAHWTLCH